MLPRQSRVLEFWDRSKDLNVKNNEYQNLVKHLFGILLRSDIKKADLTTNSLIKRDKLISVAIVAKEDGVLAGFEEFLFLNRGFEIKPLKEDGDKIKNDEIIVKINGNARKILSRERTSLNLLQRMSGIATLTNKLRKKLNNNMQIAATRKTLWGSLDKKAVSIGSGLTHRLNLSDGILIKDNHLKMANYNFDNVLNFVKNKSKYVEIEVENIKQALFAATAMKKVSKNSKNIFAIMLDKIKPEVLKSIIDELKNKNFYDDVLLEASGNIIPENIHKYSDCGADIVSMGCLTNSAKALNISLEVI